MVAEGWKRESLPAIEVRRHGARSIEPLAGDDRTGCDRILARVGDAVEADEPPEGTPLIGAGSDVGEALADIVVQRVLVRTEAVR